ncbi:MAG: hypothetical protein Q8O00_09490 [Holophaga sp.]|nr:hypothetical protein [Holophaga sp.]
MNFTRKRQRSATTAPKTAIARFVLQAKTAVLQEGTYTGSLSEWIAAALVMAEQAYYLATTPPEEIIQRQLEAAKLKATFEGERITVEGMIPFVPKPKRLEWIQPELFERG